MVLASWGLGMPSLKRALGEGVRGVEYQPLGGIWGVEMTRSRRMYAGSGEEGHAGSGEWEGRGGGGRITEGVGWLKESKSKNHAL